MWGRGTLQLIGKRDPTTCRGERLDTLWGRGTYWLIGEGGRVDNSWGWGRDGPYIGGKDLKAYRGERLDRL